MQRTVPLAKARWRPSSRRRSWPPLPCEAAQGQVIEPVNFNAPGQVVIADTPRQSRAIEAAKLRGAKRAMALPNRVRLTAAMIGAAGTAAERWQRSSW
jgi:[acyl-carrier-protein] S-malonyltransferase